MNFPKKQYLRGFVFYSVLSGVAMLQSFDRPPVYTEVNPGVDAKLSCVVLNKKGSCYWQKDRKPVGMQKGKYEWASASQESGDCSLVIRTATLEFDDGQWECQVTASDFTAQDALTSPPAQLVVRVMPQTPRIEHNGSQVQPGRNVTVKSGDTVLLKCSSRFGNPPARLKWFIGEEELREKGENVRSSELEDKFKRMWMSSSMVEFPVQKMHHGRMVRCVAFHESYPTKSQAAEVRLDVTYAPEVRLVGTPHQDLEAGKDSIVLTCLTDANPPANVIWRRSGSSDIASLTEALHFQPVTQRDSGSYSCVAKNSVGTSQPLTTTLDIKYPPLIKSVGPDRVTTAHLFSSNTEFTCSADGNPAPTYQWMQRSVAAPDVAIPRGNEPRLRFSNVTYDEQGEYVCVVSNIIGGVPRVQQSQPISLQVVGGPLVMKSAVEQTVIAQRGEDTVLKMIVCSDPRPTRTLWEWGSMKVESGTGVGKYRAEELLQDVREDCYEARLHVREVEHLDSRNYQLIVQNERGSDHHSIHLAVREPLGFSTVLTIAASSLAAFLLCVVLCVYIIRSQKCCFSKKGDFKPSDLESEKGDMNNSLNHKVPRIEPMLGTGGGNVDMMYGTSMGRRMQSTPSQHHTISMGRSSPEAMKVRLAAMVLQPPTRV